MRVRIVFNLLNKGANLPFHHQYLLSQLVRGVCLRGNDITYIDFSDYNFSGLKGQTRISRQGLHYYSSKVTLVFSCGDAGFMDYFLDRLFDMEEFELGMLKLSPTLVEKEEPVRFSEKMKYVCISPTVLKRPAFDDITSKLFVNPEDELFSDLLYDSTMERLERCGRFSESQMATFSQFQVVPDNKYLQKLEAGNKKFARVYPVYENDLKYEVRGYTFPFTLHADKKVQEFIFNYGFGALCHKGFGMIDMANVDPIRRVVSRKQKVLA